MSNGSIIQWCWWYQGSGLPWFQENQSTLNSNMKSGAHRVQRVPVTESQGRVHTSTATVLVMPEVEEMEYEIDPRDPSCRYLSRLWCRWTERQ